MSDFRFDSKIAKRVARKLAEKGIDYSLVADHSSIFNEEPSSYPGNFGNDIDVIIQVREQDDSHVIEIAKDINPRDLEKETPAKLYSGERFLLETIRKLTTSLKRLLGH